MEELNRNGQNMGDAELKEIAGGSNGEAETLGYAVVCGKCRQNIGVYPTMAEADQHAWTYCPTCGRQAMTQGYSNYISRVTKKD